MTYKPCRHCRHKPTCEILATVKKKLKESGLSTMLPSVKIRCKDREKGIDPGMRVSVELVPRILETHYDYGGYPYQNLETQQSEIRCGTVMKWHRGKVMVWLDEPVTFLDRESIRVRLHPDRLTILDEPTVKVCRVCGRPDGKQNEERWGCEECDGPYDSEYFEP
jgi:hypothetical protein